jgi:hypothetical protein
MSHASYDRPAGPALGRFSWISHLHCPESQSHDRRWPLQHLGQASSHTCLGCISRTCWPRAQRCGSALRPVVQPRDARTVPRCRGGCTAAMSGGCWTVRSPAGKRCCRMGLDVPREYLGIHVIRADHQPNLLARPDHHETRNSVTGLACLRAASCLMPTASRRAAVIVRPNHKPAAMAMLRSPVANRATL